MNSNYSKPINLGNPKESTILELAELIQGELKLKLKYKFMPLPNDDPLKRCPSIELAKKELNWSPQIDIRDGLNNTINYYEKSLKFDL